MEREANVERSTKETSVKIKIGLDKAGLCNVSSSNGFFDHMLELFAKHGGFSLELTANGDTHIDWHHTVEDIGIVLGKAFYEALGDKKGIERYGFFILPMDETLIEVAVDFGGRSYLNYDVKCYSEQIGGVDVELFKEFFKAFSDNAKCNLHIVKRYGENTHHIIEGIFKAVARAIRAAVMVVNSDVPSTKGVIE